MWRSVPQTEATFTFTRTSSGPICGTGIWRTSAPGAASGFTTASMVSDIRVPGTDFGRQTPHFSKHVGMAKRAEAGTGRRVAPQANRVGCIFTTEARRHGEKSKIKIAANEPDPKRIECK